MSLSGVIEGQNFRRILNKISNIFVLVVLTLATLLIALRLFGFNIYTIMSGSMEPSLPVGSLVYTKPIDPDTLEIGDTITYMASETTTVTHRIVEIVTETDQNGTAITKFRTKGDANNTPDGKLVHPQNILGIAVFNIPFLGYLSYWLQHPPGTYIALVLGTFLISLIIIPSAIKRKEEQTITTPN